MGTFVIEVTQGVIEVTQVLLVVILFTLIYKNLSYSYLLSLS